MTKCNKIVLRGGRVMLFGSEEMQCDIAVDAAGTRIATAEDAADAEIFDITGKLVLPGLVDVHVHLREPGYAYKETIASGSRAAAAGGFTTVCAMPNLNPVPDCAENIAVEQEIIDRDAVVRVLPYASITRGRRGEGQTVNFAELKDSVAGFSDDGCGVRDAAVMEQAMREAKACGAMIVAHCEDETLVRGGCIHDGGYAAAHNLRGICSESEWRQVERDIELAERTGCRYHVCHVSTAESVGLIRRAKARGADVSCETAPHYLLLCDSDLKDEGRFKMNPPIRSARDRDALVEGILDGTIDMIATDHAPHSAEEKSRGLEGSAFGIVGLETAFPLMYTHFVRTGKMTMEQLAELMSHAPRRRFGMGDAAADIAVFDLDERYKICAGDLLSAGKATPFEGWEVFGRCIMTIVGGRVVFRRHATTDTTTVTNRDK